MPKRAPTPPPADDTRFFTVVNPYPEQPYLALDDSRTFARWIACIIGQEHLLAFYHKPKSPNVVLIETLKFGPDFDRLMGEHRWRKFLKKPSPVELREVSSIFPCTLTTTRMVQKAGWICRDIPSSWFRKWSPDTESLLVSPYPQPRYCEPPVEDITRHPLCKPIPKRDADKSTSKPSSALGHNRSKSSSTASDFDDAPTSPSTSTSDVSEIGDTAPPGLIHPSQRFIPAIHGSDIPKASDVVVALSSSSSPAPANPVSSDAGDDGDDDGEAQEAEKSLCSAHGALCVSGICKECAERKREARFAERARQRDHERGHRGGARGRGLGWGQRQSPHQGDQHEREARRELGSASGRSQAEGRVAPVPPHLKNWSAVVKGSSGAAASDARSRLRDDIRVEMAGRKRGLKKAATHAMAHAMPAHLRKGASLPSKSGSSAASTSSASTSTFSLSEGSLSESSGLSATPSVSDASEDTRSVASSSDTQSLGHDNTHVSHAQPGARPGPWGTNVDWRTYAGIKAGEDTESVATSATGGAFKNPWKHVRSMEHAFAPRWASNVDKLNMIDMGIRSAWDDVESDEDEEPF